MGEAHGIALDDHLPDAKCLALAVQLCGCFCILTNILIRAKPFANWLEIICPTRRARPISPTGSCKSAKLHNLFSVAFGNLKCYYSLCFKESDSLIMVFDRLVCDVHA